uniref:Uncharacterized protein n=1 Tax=Ficedula albicollis TaxID=59894 RepID=A0A803VLN9_FICAL
QVCPAPGGGSPLGGCSVCPHCVFQCWQCSQCPGALSRPHVSTPGRVSCVMVLPLSPASGKCFLYCNGLMDHLYVCQNGNGCSAWYKAPGHFTGTLGDGCASHRHLLHHLRPAAGLPARPGGGLEPLHPPAGWGPGQA